MLERSMGVRGLCACVGLALAMGCASGRPAAAPPPAQPVEPAARPTPPPAADVVIPPFTAQVEARLRADVEAVRAAHTFTIPVSARTPVLKTIHHLQNHPDARLLAAAGIQQAPPYRQRIEASLTHDGLPPELSFVAQAESAFLAPDLRGKGLAMGVWQMIPSTARHYGLRVDDQVDERADVFKATDASVRHLFDLHATFKDWELVITGFYAGAGIVSRGLELSGAKDAWTLITTPGALPEETRGYLPLVYALAIISQDPARFGFTEAVTDAQLAELRASFDRYYTNRYPADLFGP